MTWETHWLCYIQNHTNREVVIFCFLGCRHYNDGMYSNYVELFHWLLFELGAKTVLVHRNHHNVITLFSQTALHIEGCDRCRQPLTHLYCCNFHISTQRSNRGGPFLLVCLWWKSQWANGREYRRMWEMLFLNIKTACLKNILFGKQMLSKIQKWCHQTINKKFLITSTSSAHC